MTEGENDSPKKSGKLQTIWDLAGNAFRGGRHWVRKTDPRLRRYLFANFVVLGVGYVVLEFSDGKHPLNEIASSVIAAGLTGLVFLLYQALLYQDDRRAKQLHEVGLEAVYTDRSSKITSEYRHHLQQARKSIDLMGFGLQHFREDFDGVDGWWNGKPDVRILVLNPTFPDDAHSYARQRDAEEESAQGTIAAHVENFVRYLRRDLGEVTAKENAPLAHWEDPKRGSTLQLKLAECIPAVTVFRIDEVAYWGPYLIERPSRKCPTLQVRSGRPLFDAIDGHFEAIWENWSTDVPEDWLDE